MTAARLRAPWALRLAGIAWLCAGLVTVLSPAIAVLLQHLQYRSLRRSAVGATGLAEALDPTEQLELGDWVLELERWEATIGEVAWPILLPLIVGYALLACLLLAGYVAVSVPTMRGAG